MNHQPFEDWIFEAKLTHDEEKQLHKHLATCQDCSRLRQAMKGMERTFSSPVHAGPKAGFAMRWQKMAVEREDDNQQSAAWYMVAGLVLLMTWLVYLNFGANWFANFNLLTFLVQRTVNLIQTVGSLFNTITSLANAFQTIPGQVVFVVSLVLGAISFFWIVLWFSAMRRIFAAQRKAI